MKYQLDVVNTYTHVETDADVYIGRGSPLGNPFSIEIVGPTRDEVIALYEVWLKDKLTQNDEAVCDELNRIATLVAEGKEVKLVCFCKPQKCHGDLIQKIILNALKTERLK